MMFCQLFEHALGGGVAGLRLLENWKSQLLEEDDLKLFGTPDEKFLSGQSIDLRLDAHEFLLEFLREMIQMLFVDSNTGALHSREHGGQRNLDAIEEVGEALVFQFHSHRIRHGRQRLGLCEGPSRNVFDPQILGRPGARAPPGEIFPRRDALAEIFDCQAR